MQAVFPFFVPLSQKKEGERSVSIDWSKDMSLQNSEKQDGNEPVDYQETRAMKTGLRSILVADSSFTTSKHTDPIACCS